MPRNNPILIGALFAAGTLISCIFDSGCEGDSTPPTNVIAVAGNGQVSLSWDVSSSTTVFSEVRYAPGDSSETDCSAEVLPAGCVLACPPSTATACTVIGLANDSAYTFTVATSTAPVNPSCHAGFAYARSETVTPTD
jgi:hypothetical protein